MLDLVVKNTWESTSRVLVLRGEAGIGKTALVSYLVGAAAGCRIASVGSDESEMELAYAGLQQLCAPMLSELWRLPGPRQEALSAAFGLTEGGRPDQFLIGLAVLDLLSNAAVEQPLICIVDDAQWLDSASVECLTFVGRRLMEERISLVFAVSDACEENALVGFESLMLQGLNEDDAGSLLDSVMPGPIDRSVRDRILSDAHGNPLALLNTTRGLTAADQAGGFGVAEMASVGGQTEESFRRKIVALPVDTRRLLLVAAVEPVGDANLLWGAVAKLGIGGDAALPAEAAGLIKIGARVRFAHPLVRSAVCRSALTTDLHEAHRVLADVTDPVLDSDRKAWHRARTGLGPNEQVAHDLEKSACQAFGRGGVAAAALFLERATELSPEPVVRAERALKAAWAKQRAGAPDAALELLGLAEGAPLDRIQRAQSIRLRGLIALSSNRRHDAPGLLLQAANMVEQLDAGLSNECRLDALAAALSIGRQAGALSLSDVARSVQMALSDPPDRKCATANLLVGLASSITDDLTVGGPMLKVALSVIRDTGVSGERADYCLWLAGHVSMSLLDDQSWDVLTMRHVRAARKGGLFAQLPAALEARLTLHLYAGEFNEAASLVRDINATTAAIGSRRTSCGPLQLAAWQGREIDTVALLDNWMSEVGATGDGAGLTLIFTALAVLYNGLGRYDLALDAAERASENPEEQVFTTLVLPELIEAAVRSGQEGRAADALELLAETTRVSGTCWAVGIEARCRALVDRGEDAEHLYVEAIDHLTQTRVRMELARSHLLFGEWLRRENRRVDSREHLRTAHTMFAEMGADGFAERVQREMLATGETARKRTVETVLQLTAQEAQIARLAAGGRTNQEIGAELFISPRTVEWHLRKVYPKLGINSRKQLQRIPGQLLLDRANLSRDPGSPNLPIRDLITAV